MLQEGEGEHRHERMAVETLPGSPFEVIEAKFLFQLLMGERTVLNQILRFANARATSANPRNRHSIVAANSGPETPETEWRTLYTYLRKYVKEAQDKRRHRERFYLQHLHFDPRKQWDSRRRGEAPEMARHIKH